MLGFNMCAYRHRVVLSHLLFYHKVKAFFTIKKGGGMLILKKCLAQPFITRNFTLAAPHATPVASIDMSIEK
jgi:hypothetical protein